LVVGTFCAKVGVSKKSVVAAIIATPNRVRFFVILLFSFTGITVPASLICTIH